MYRFTERFLNQRFGKLKVIKFEGRTKRGQSIWLCECDCGIKKKIRGDHLLNSATKSCGCNQRGSGNARWKGFGEISGWLWNNYKIAAKKRGLLFELDIKEAWELFLKQERKCALTGEILTFPIDFRSHTKANASLDRIDSSKGYLVENVQWVTKKINLIKWNLPQKDFVDICKAVVKNYTK